MLRNLHRIIYIRTGRDFPKIYHMPKQFSFLIWTFFFPSVEMMVELAFVELDIFIS